MKYKLVRSEHARSDETILEARSLDEMVRLLREKSGQTDPSEIEIGGNGGIDLGLGDDGGGLL